MRLAKKLEAVEYQGKQIKVISEDDVPSRMGTQSARVIALCKSIPKGGAISVTKDDIGMISASVYILVNKMKRKGELPKGFYCTTRTVNGKKIMYLVNSTKPSA